MYTHLNQTLLRKITILLVAAQFHACGSDNNERSPHATPEQNSSSINSSGSNTQSLVDRDMTGTWQLFTVSKRFNLITQEYYDKVLGSELIFIEDRHPEEIYHYFCDVDYGESQRPFNARKTEDSYFDYFGAQFELLNNDSLVHRSSFSASDEADILRYDSEEYLFQISDQRISSNGTFLLTSPVNLNHSTRTCTKANYDHTGEIRGVQISFPYGDGALGLWLQFNGPIEPGLYEYGSQPSGPTKPIRLGLLHNTAFEAEIGADDEYYGTSDTLNVSVEITIFDEDRITGNFSFNREFCCENPGAPYPPPPLIHFEGEFDISLEHHKIPNF